MLSYKDALQIITSCVLPNETQDKDLPAAAGHFLGHDVCSLVTLPMHAAAFKDGFAVRFAEVAAATPDNAVKLKIAGESFAGSPYQPNEFPALTACKITTGAYIPQSFDTVVPFEDCSVQGTEVVITKAPMEHQDVTPAGQELVTGEVILRKGICLKPADIGLAAAAGHAQLPVVRPPRVGVISTGNELVLPGTPLKDGQIYSSNQFQLKTQLENMHMPTETIIVEDDFAATRQAVLDLVDRNDVVISSGGSADSEKDFMRHVLGELGWRLMAERIDIKPGHTLRFGLLYNKPFFVLPGTPSGTEICFNIFVLPQFRKMAGADNIWPNAVYGKLTDKIKGSAKTKNITQVIVTFEPDGVMVAPVPKKCGRIKSIAQKNALVIVPKEGFSAGEIVKVIMV